MPRPGVSTRHTQGGGEVVLSPRVQKKNAQVNKQLKPRTDVSIYPPTSHTSQAQLAHDSHSQQVPLSGTAKQLLTRRGGDSYMNAVGYASSIRRNTLLHDHDINSGTVEDDNNDDDDYQEDEHDEDNDSGGSNDEEISETQLGPAKGALVPKVSVRTSMSGRQPLSSYPARASSSRATPSSERSLYVRDSSRRLPRNRSSLGQDSSTLGGAPASSPPTSIAIREHSFYKQQHEPRRRRRQPSNELYYASMFENTKKRTKTESSEGHFDMLRPCKALILARVVSGEGTMREEGGRRCDIFTNTNTEFEGRLVCSVWWEVLTRRADFGVPPNIEVNEYPTAAEARLIKDHVSDARSKILSKARDMAKTLIQGEFSQTRAKVEFLLEDHRFMCGTKPDQSEEINIVDRWSSINIVNLINEAFWIKANSGIARLKATRQYFEPLRAETIYFMVTCLCWALKEYSTGSRKMKHADHDFYELYKSYEHLWQQQSQVKKALICQILTRRVANRVRDQGESEAQQHEVDPYRDDLTALDAYREYMSPEGRMRLTKETRTSGLDDGFACADPALLTP